jgi:hypothetical protein
MKPVLKPPGPMLLKLIYEEPLSNFAFNFNLRRYNPVAVAGILADMRMDHETLIAGLLHDTVEAGAYTRPHLCST